MKVAVCPWCQGNGFIKRDQHLTYETGTTIKLEFVDCVRCETSGVIAYKSLKEIKESE